MKRKYMYGKFYHDTFEFRREVHKLFDKYLQKLDINVLTSNDLIDLRNRIVALLMSWIGSKIFEQKFGIKIPLHSSPGSVEKFIERQARSFHKIYEPCEICGEDRITNYCHIIPRSKGGPDSEENYFCLCPTHHHLFDHYRLYKEEWERLDFSRKMKASQEYAIKVRLPILERFWQEKERENINEDYTKQKR